MTVIAGLGDFGFGREEGAFQAKRYVGHRHDRKAATPTDYFLIAAVQEALGETGNTDKPREDVALFVGASTELAGGLLQALALEEVPALNADLVAEARKLNPFFALAALPNIGIYLASKYCGIAGPADQFTCAPWADVVALQAAVDMVEMGTVLYAVAGAAYARPETDSGAIFADEPTKDFAAPLDDEGAVAFLLAAGDGLPRLRRPILAVGGSRERRERRVDDWLRVNTGSTDRVLLTKDMVSFADRGSDGGDWSVFSLPNHGVPLAATLARRLASGEGGVVVVDYGDALAAGAVWAS